MKFNKYNNLNKNYFSSEKQKKFWYNETMFINLWV